MIYRITCRDCGSAAVVQTEERKRTRFTCATCGRVWFRDGVESKPRELESADRWWVRWAVANVLVSFGCAVVLAGQIAGVWRLPPEIQWMAIFGAIAALISVGVFYALRLWQ